MAKAAKATKQGGGSSLIWLQGMACGGMAALAPVAAAQVAMLLAPGLVFLMLDQQEGKPVARAMLLFGLAASVDPIRAAWVAGSGIAWDRAMDTQAMLVAWIAAAIGWLLAHALPVLVGLVVDTSHQSRAAALRETRATLVRDWGLDEEDASGGDGHGGVGQRGASQPNAQ